LGYQICAVCCGTSRLVDIACPATCGYLHTSREHPAAAVRRQQEHDVTLLLPALEGLSDAQQELLSPVFSVLLRHGAGGLAAARDPEVADGITALVATFDTAERGVIYEHRPTTLPGQRIVADLKEVFAEASQRRGRPVDGDAAAVLRRIQKLADTVRKASPGSETAFLELVGRAAAMRAAAASAAPDRQDTAARPAIIIP
jgi:hypothetical protein